MKIPYIGLDTYLLNVEPGEFKCVLPTSDHISDDANVIRFKSPEDFINNATEKQSAVFSELYKQCGFAKITNNKEKYALYDTYFLEKYSLELHGYLRYFCEVHHVNEYKQYIHDRFVIDALNRTGLIPEIQIFQAKYEEYANYDFNDHIKKCIDHYCFYSNGRYGAYKLNCNHQSI